MHLVIRGITTGVVCTVYAWKEMACAQRYVFFFPTNFPVRVESTACIFRRELCEVVQTLLYSDSTESSSSDDEDTAILLVHAAFPPKERLHWTRVCIEDMGEYECERLFR